MLLSLLTGALFPFWSGQLLIAACATTGASLCYALSHAVGKPLVLRLFPTAIASFLRTQFESTLEDFVDAIDDMVERIGIDHVAFGSDFTQDQPTSFWRYIGSQQGTKYPAIFTRRGIRYDLMDLYPTDLETPDKLPNLAAALDKRGYSSEDIGKILGLNWLRLFGDVWKA